MIQAVKTNVVNEDLIISLFYKCEVQERNRYQIAPHIITD